MGNTLKYSLSSLYSLYSSIFFKCCLKGTIFRFPNALLCLDLQFGKCCFRKWVLSIQVNLASKCCFVLCSVKQLGLQP